MSDSDDESIQFNAEPTPRQAASAFTSRVVSPSNQSSTTAFRTKVGTHGDNAGASWPHPSRSSLNPQSAISPAFQYNPLASDSSSLSHQNRYARSPSASITFTKQNSFGWADGNGSDSIPVEMLQRNKTRDENHVLPIGLENHETHKIPNGRAVDSRLPISRPATPPPVPPHQQTPSEPLTTKRLSLANANAPLAIAGLTTYHQRFENAHRAPPAVSETPPQRRIDMPIHSRDSTTPIRTSRQTAMEYKPTNEIDTKIFMNIHSNVFHGDVQFRKMAPDTKFSRLLKGLLIATRDRLRGAEPLPSSQPLPPPPLSSGDLYFRSSGIIVDVNATPRQYGLDISHSDEDNGLELIFNYHPIGPFRFSDFSPSPFSDIVQPGNESTATQHNLGGQSYLSKHGKEHRNSQIVNARHAPMAGSPRSSQSASPTRPTDKRDNSMPTPPQTAPQRPRMSPRFNETLDKSSRAKAPEVPRHRSPQKTQLNSVPHASAHRADTTISSSRAADHSHVDTRHFRTAANATTFGGVATNTSHRSVGGAHRRETPHRRILSHEPRIAQEAIKTPWPNDVPFRATLAASAPHLTNRSVFSQRSANSSLSLTSEKARASFGPGGAQRPESKTHQSSLPVSTNSEEHFPSKHTELELELEKAMKLLTERKRSVSRSRSPFLQIDCADETSDEEHCVSLNPISRNHAPAHQSDKADIANYHEQLIRQLKIERSRLINQNGGHAAQL